MGFDLEKRIATDLNRLEDEVDHVQRGPQKRSAKQVEAFKRIAEQLKARLLGAESAEGHPGKQTEVQGLVSGAVSRMSEIARRAQDAFAMMPWQSPSRFDDYRVTALHEVIGALGSSRRPLARATVASADPTIGSRIGPMTAATSPAGQTMWRVAERRAATLYRHAMDGGEVAGEDPVVDEALARCGAGQALPTAVRRKMEADLGISLARVRVHTDPLAAQAAKAVRAEAFTVGEDIFFAEQMYAPDSKAGQKLLAHELAHVVQAYQGRTSTSGQGISVSQPGEALEREAEAVADRIEAKTERRAARKAQRTPSAQGARARGVREAPAMAPANRGLVLRREASNPPSQEGNGPYRPGRSFDPSGRQRPQKPKIEVEHKKTPVGAQHDNGQTAKDTRNTLGKTVRGAVADLRQEVSDAQKKPTGVEAKQAAKTEQSKHKSIQKAAADAKKKVKAKAPGKGTGGGAKESKGKGGGGPVKFKKISDWNKYLPADLPDTDAREKKKILGLIKKKVNEDREASAKMLNKLRLAQIAQAKAVRALAPGLQAKIAAAQGAALGQVAAAEASQCAAVSSHVAGVSASVRSHAGAMCGQIASAHSATLSAIRAAKSAAIQKLTSAKTKAIGDIGTSQSTQLQAISTEYTIATGRLVGAGAALAGQARAKGSMSLPYSGDKLEAARKAAQDTANGYAKAMPEKTSGAAAQLRSTKSEVDSQATEYASQIKDTVGDVFDQNKEAIEKAAEQAIEAANKMKAAAIDQVNSTATSTCSQLATHGTSQVAAIRSAGAAARSGINSAGNNAKKNVAAGCEAAAKGLEDGAKGLMAGAKLMEAPDPDSVKKQVDDSSKALTQGLASIRDGLTQKATQAGASLKEQAQGAATGMAETAAQAKATATGMGTSAKGAMSKAAAGTAQSLQTIGSNAETQCESAADKGKTAIEKQVEGLKKAYEGQLKGLAKNLDKQVEDVKGKLTDCINTKEEPEILKNAKEAADAVPDNWWQKVAAFVVKIAIAIVITIVVVAVVAGTGGIGAMIIAGAIAGGLSYAAGEMASNAILGKSLLDGMSWKGFAGAVLGGALTGGLSGGLGGLAARTAAGSFGSAGLRSGAGALATALKGGGGLTGYGLRVGTDVLTGIPGDIASQLVEKGKYEFTMKSLLQSVATSAVTSGSKFSAFQDGAKARIRSKLPSVDIQTPGWTAQGKSNAFDVTVNKPGQQGGVPKGGDSGGGAPKSGSSGDGPSAKGNTDGPSAKGNTDGGSSKSAKDGPSNKGDNDGPSNKGDNDGASTKGDKDGASTKGDKDGDGADGKPDKDGASNKGDKDGGSNKGDKDGDGKADKDGASNKADKDGDGKVDGAGDKGDKGGGGKGGKDSDGDGVADKGGADKDGGGKGGGDKGDEGGGGDKDGAAGKEGPENSSADELAEIGYSAPTRQAGDSAADAIQTGKQPKKADVRDTAANQKGLRDLEAVQNDPKLPADSKQNINKDVANQLRGDEPTGNLPRDIQEAKVREQARLDAENAKPGAKPEGPGGKDGATGKDGAATGKDGKAAGPEGQAAGKGDPTNPNDVLRMNYKDFATNPTAQKTLFDAATGAVARMKAAAAKITAGIDGATSSSLKKRPELDSFVQEVLNKQRSKNYGEMGEMTDIIRGRFNVDNAADMAKVAQRLQDQFAGNIAEIKKPRPGYPRWHINVIDGPTGLVHEWQVGTKATTDFFERRSLKIPDTVKTFKGQPDFHDGVYKLLDRVDDATVRQQHGLDDIKKDYTSFAEETGKGQPQNYEQRYNDMAARINDAMTKIEQANPGYLDGVLAGGGGKH